MHVCWCIFTFPGDSNVLRTILIGKTVEQSFFGPFPLFPFNLSLYLPQRASASTHNWQHLLYLFNSKLIQCHCSASSPRGGMHLHQISEVHCNEWNRGRDDKPLRKGKWGSQGRECPVRGGSPLQLGVSVPWLNEVNFCSAPVISCQIFWLFMREALSPEFYVKYPSMYNAAVAMQWPLFIATLLHLLWPPTPTRGQET